MVKPAQDRRQVGELNGAFQRGRGGPGGWWILFEPELQLVPLEPVWLVDPIAALELDLSGLWA